MIDCVVTNFCILLWYLRVRALLTLTSVQAIMSEYKKLCVGELQTLCEERGIDPSGLNRTGLINALRRDNYESEIVRQSKGK